MLLEILMEIVLTWAFHVAFSSISYLVNMTSFCIGSISQCCFIVLLFRCSSHVPLFRGILIVPSVFRCSASVPVFCQCSSVPPIFRVPQFRAPVFLVLQHASSRVFFKSCLKVMSFLFFILFGSTLLDRYDENSSITVGQKAIAKYSHLIGSDSMILVCRDRGRVLRST